MIILLTQNKVTHVSSEDYEFLMQWKWCALKIRRHYYAVRMQGDTFIYMHRLVAERCELDITDQIDHRDGDGLNNLRSNLRSATHAQNLQNRGKNKNNSSGYKGVIWDKDRSKWRAEIQANGKSRYLGRFDTKTLAAKAYQEAAKKLHGEFAQC